jgi:hypothetical protein
MPEQISKYPDVTLKILKEAGAVCGQGAPQKILTKCPADRFCALPTGEVCVYGVNEIPRMTQISTRDLAPVVCPRAQPGGDALAEAAASLDGLVLGTVLVAGLTLGQARRLLRRRRGGR